MLYVHALLLGASIVVFIWAASQGRFTLMITAGLVIFSQLLGSIALWLSAMQPHKEGK